MFGVAMFFRLKFDWLLLVATALALSGANIIGYVRCKSGVHVHTPICPAVVPYNGRALPTPRRPDAPTPRPLCRPPCVLADARAKITSAVTSRLGGSFASQAMQSAAGKAFGF